MPRLLPGVIAGPVARETATSALTTAITAFAVVYNLCESTLIASQRSSRVRSDRPRASRDAQRRQATRYGIGHYRNSRRRSSAIPDTDGQRQKAAETSTHPGHARHRRQEKPSTRGIASDQGLPKFSQIISK